MFDDFKKGTAFDWISPLKAELDDLRNGPRVDLHIAEGSISGVEAKRLLKRCGIHFWGVIIGSHTLMITVRRQEAERARRLLAEAGARLVN